jgi:hypothetical protein
MLVIREEQMRRLEEVLSPGIFRAKMLRRLQAHSSGKFAQCSAAEIAAFVSSGQRRAGDYGLTDFEAVAQFFELMIVFGEEFPSGQEWALAVLGRREGKSQASLIEALLQAAVRFLDEDERSRAAALAAETSLEAEPAV